MPEEAKSGELVTTEDEDSSLLSCPEHSFDPTIQAQSRAEVVMTDDVRALNHSLQQLGKAWVAATCIDDVCKLSTVTVKLLLERRRLMLLTLEPDESKGKKKNYLEPAPREVPKADNELERDPRYS